MIPLELFWLNTDGYTLYFHYRYEKNMQGDIIAVYDNDGMKLVL